MLGKLLYWTSRLVATSLARTFWRLRVEGREHVPVAGPYLLAATHASFLDPPVVGISVPAGLSFLARGSLSTDRHGRRRPLKAWALRSLGVVEVSREGVAAEAVRVTIATLVAGGRVLIFPEGTRTRDGGVQPFRAGVGLIALRSGCPVVPVSLEGTANVWPRGRSLPRFGGGPVTIRFGEPITYEKPWKAKDVAADLRGRILDLRGDTEGRDTTTETERREEARDGADLPAADGDGPSR